MTGNPNNRVMVPTWAATVGAMKENGVRCAIHCGGCGFWKEVQLDPIIEKMGADFSLWDKHPICRDKCGGRYKRSFLYHHGVMRPMMTKFPPMSL